MKKLGFTMAELLVTLAIVAIAAAITAPIIDNIIPDKNKAKVLKVYKTLSEINNEILNDPSLYMSDGSCEGTDCRQAPLDPNYASSTGIYKYPTLVMSRLDIDRSTFWGNIMATFTTKDGIWWQFVPIQNGANSGKYGVIIDLDSNITSVTSLGSDTTGGNQTYSATCKKPDRFSFLIEKNGLVVPSDKLTQAYLMNPNKLNDKKTDYAKAKELLGN